MFIIPFIFRNFFANSSKHKKMVIFAFRGGLGVAAIIIVSNFGNKDLLYAISVVISLWSGYIASESICNLIDLFRNKNQNELKKNS